MNRSNLGKYASSDPRFNLYDLAYLFVEVMPTIVMLFCVLKLADPNLPRETAGDLKLVLGASGGLTLNQVLRKK